MEGQGVVLSQRGSYTAALRLAFKTAGRLHRTQRPYALSTDEPTELGQTLAANTTHALKQKCEQIPIGVAAREATRMILQPVWVTDSGPVP